MITGILRFVLAVGAYILAAMMLGHTLRRIRRSLPVPGIHPVRNPMPRTAGRYGFASRPPTPHMTPGIPVNV